MFIKQLEIFLLLSHCIFETILLPSYICIETHSLEKISDTVPFLVVKLQFIEIFQIYCWLMIYDVAHLLVVNQNRCCMSSGTFLLTVLCCIYFSASHMPHLSLHCHSRHYRKDCNYSELSYFSCIFFSFCCI